MSWKIDPSQVPYKVLRDGEDDSTATSATHGIEKTAETSIRTATFTYRSSKLKPYKDADKAEKQADKANIRALDKQAKYKEQISLCDFQIAHADDKFVRNDVFVKKVVFLSQIFGFFLQNLIN